MPQVTLSYSKTQCFLETSNTQEVQTKTITWTLDSSLEIQRGQFLDGSWWVVNNGDINLIATTPAEVNRPIVAFGAFTQGVKQIVVGVTMNGTVINPDFGRAWVSAPYTFGGLSLVNFPERNTGFTESGYGGETRSDGRPLWDYYGFDSRWQNSIYYAIGDENNPTYTHTINSTQRWNRSPRKLNNGDMVVVGYSRYLPPDLPQGQGGATWQFGSPATQQYPTNFNGVLLGVGPWPTMSNLSSRSLLDTPIMDMFGALTVVASPPPPNSYRPPLNWDPSDRANAPIFQEVNDLDVDPLLVDDLPYSIDFNNRTYGPISTSDPNRGIYSWGLTGNSNYGQSQKSIQQDFLGFTSERNYEPFQVLIGRVYQDGAFNHKLHTGLAGSFLVTGYGGKTNRYNELQSAAIMHRGVPSETRKRIRRSFVQRGIDLYGARRSLGKGVGGNGGHSMDYTLPEIYAYVATGSQDMYRLLSLRDFGNTGNDTYTDLSRQFYTKGYGSQYHDNCQMRIIRKTPFNHKKHQHPTRWSKLPIKQIITGKDEVVQPPPYNSPFLGMTWGEFQMVRVAAPDGNHCNPGTPLWEFPPQPNGSMGLTATWNRDKLYNISPQGELDPYNYNPNNNGPATPSRWNVSTNLSSYPIRASTLLGGWLRTNTGKITRIIGSVPCSNKRPPLPQWSPTTNPYLSGNWPMQAIFSGMTSSTAFGGWLDGNTYWTDSLAVSDIIFFTIGQGVTFGPEDTTVDIAPFIKEQIDELPAGGVIPHTTIPYGSMNAETPYDYYSYKNFHISIPVTTKWAEKCCNYYNLPIPLKLENMLKVYDWYFEDTFRMSSIFFNSNPPYDCWLVESYLALVRHFYGKQTNSGDPDFPYPKRMPVPHTQATRPPGIRAWQNFYDNPSNWRGSYAGVYPRRDAWPQMPATRTWLEVYTPPPNITVVSGGSIPQTNNPIPWYAENNPAKVGSCQRCFFTSHYDPGKRAQDIPVLYLLSNPYQGGPPFTSLDTGINFNQYIQGKTLYIWFAGQSIPIKLKLAKEEPTSNQLSWQQWWELPEGFRNLSDALPDKDSSVLGGIQHRVFFADDDPRFEWEPDTTPYDTDLNNDGRTDALDLAIFLGEYGKTGVGITGDFNGDGVVDQQDLTILLSNWGSPGGSPRLLAALDPKISIRLSTNDISSDATWKYKIPPADFTSPGITHGEDQYYSSDKVKTMPNPLVNEVFNQYESDEVSAQTQSEATGVADGYGGAFIDNSTQVQDYQVSSAPLDLNVLDVLPQVQDYLSLSKNSGGETLSLIMHGKNDLPDTTTEYDEANLVIQNDTLDQFDPLFYQISSWVTFNSRDNLSEVPKLTNSKISFRKHPHQIYFQLKKQDIREIRVNINFSDISSNGNARSRVFFNQNSPDQTTLSKLLRLNEGYAFIPNAGPGTNGATYTCQMNNVNVAGTPTLEISNATQGNSLAISQNVTQYYHYYYAQGVTPANTTSFGTNFLEFKSSYSGGPNIPLAQRPIFKWTGWNQTTTDPGLTAVDGSISQDAARYLMVEGTAPISVRVNLPLNFGSSTTFAKNILAIDYSGSSTSTPRLFGGSNNIGIGVGSYIRISGSVFNNGLYQVREIIDGIDGDANGNVLVNGTTRFQYLVLNRNITIESDRTITIENISSLPVLHIKYRVGETPPGGVAGFEDPFTNPDLSGPITPPDTGTG